jgi:O-antigen ligase
MSFTQKYPASAVPTLAFFTISALTFLAFRMPMVAGLGLCVLCVLGFGLRFPILTLYIYAAASFLSYIPLFASVKVGVPTLAGALFLLATGANAGLCVKISRANSSIYGWLLYFVIACFIAALLNPRWFLSNPRGLITFISLALTTIAAAYLLRSQQLMLRVGYILSTGAVMVAALTCYQSLTGAYNSLGLFHSNTDRAYGIADPNYTAAILVTLFPLLFAQSISAKRLLSRMIIASGLAIVLTGIGMTASRGGFLGMVLTGFVCLFIVSSAEESTLKFPAIARRIGFAVLLLCAFAIALTATPDSLWNRLSSLQDRQKVDNESRLDLWAVYTQEWLASPVFGHGPGYMDPEALENRINIPHNTPIELLLAIGGFGFLAYAGLSLCAIRELWRARRAFSHAGNSRMRAFASALIAAFIGFHFTALFLNRGDDKKLWFLFGVATAVVALSRRQSLSSAPLVPAAMALHEGIR